ncbi:Uma2 family endonuclease [Dolichospermum sp. ST_con]|nr:Uma2 family endonuclease [Dolichospermum sp. ST_con]MDD1420324.1 Uma2 family endonuclease [Dolichospermum sp. ST_sed1]MDD1425386.1 Uma2 family endonuclease [Dolichospermum sp. ST_sed9]MDD1430848.1 Uma2 family endonuclease [Dolichospermum sp. ST_sed6]MDD1436984.1 Uma2 family endonuclease [Dolichospermum sp. ST_sed10]MDD1441804.1 Uma2 family endonuclease [Dolichospermum sp. ST_sed3]MDD1446084.1 Uma2 family endonuclease [Dolichospermum sp. ST_sed8]MDD1454263.1 Uma2 family endonuclease [Dolic
MVIANLPNIVTDTWVNVSWDEFMEFVDHPNYQQGRFYYYQDYMRVEMSPVGSIHGNNNNVVANVVNLYATLKNIKIKGWVNTSFRRTSESECQPDLAFYIGDKVKFPPLNNSPVNINELAAPTLVVEIAAASINDDLGFKRLLYERLGVKEYWVMDANNDDIIAFEIVDGGSRRIEESKVLPGLQIATVKEAIHRSLTQDDGEVNRWLLGIFS